MQRPRQIPTFVSMIIAFTGHRDYDAERINETLYRRIALLALLNDGVTFLCGMAVGFDLAAAEAVMRVKQDNRSVRLKCVIPFSEQTKYFSYEDQLRYARVLESADEVVVLEGEYSQLVFLRRNDYLVDHADMILAYFKDGSKGGTAYTIRRARKARITIENLYPQQQLSLF